MGGGAKKLKFKINIEKKLIKNFSLIDSGYALTLSASLKSNPQKCANIKKKYTQKFFPIHVKSPEDMKEVNKT